MARRCGSTLDHPFGEPGKYDRVAVVVQRPRALRALTLRAGIRTAAVAVWLTEGTRRCRSTPRPEWPALESSRRGGTTRAG